MKIPLKVVDDKLTLNTTLSSTKYRIGYAKVLFIVDTGSPITFISEGDALRMSLPISTLEKKELLRLGGTKSNLLKLSKPFIMYIRNEEDKVNQFDLSKYSVAKCTKKDEQNKQIALSIPSIIGMDFLRDNKLKLFYDAVSGEAYLETQ